MRCAEELLGSDACHALIRKYFGTGDFYSAKSDMTILAFCEELHQMLGKR